MIRGDQIKPGAVVIDVGMNWTEGAWATWPRWGGGRDHPRPRRRGPVTIAILLRNTVAAARLQRGGPKPPLTYFHRREWSARWGA